MTMASRSVKIIAYTIGAFLLSSVGAVMCYRFLPVRTTALMLIRQAEARGAGERLAIRRQWVSLEDVSPNIVVSVVNSEDAHFYEHHGFDMDAIANAYRINRAYGQVVMGGSTISQQTAKNVFCTPSRTYSRKVIEAYFTVLIEFLWGKDRIMEVYLNVIEWGNGVFGVEAASEYYFGHSARYLTEEEVKYLTRLIPNPHGYLVD